MNQEQFEDVHKEIIENHPTMSDWGKYQYMCSKAIELGPDKDPDGCVSCGHQDPSNLKWAGWDWFCKPCWNKFISRLLYDHLNKVPI